MDGYSDLRYTGAPDECSINWPTKIVDCTHCRQEKIVEKGLDFMALLQKEMMSGDFSIGVSGDMLEIHDAINHFVRAYRRS